MAPTILYMKFSVSAFLFSAVLLLGSSAGAQRRDNSFFREPHFVEPVGWSLGITLGTSDLWADVGTKGIIDHYNNENYTDHVYALGSLYGRYTFRPAIAARLAISYGRVGAADNFNINKARKASTIEDDAFQRYLRNQDVRTDIWESYLVAEIMPLRFNMNSRMSRRRFQPYVALGIGGFYNRPFGTYTARNGSGGGRYIDLTTLHLEGQEFKGSDGKPLEGAPKKDNLFHVSVPAGLGVRWDIGEHLGLGLEYLYRYTFTDQMDGVSTKYIDPTLFDANLSAQNAAIARDMYDKSWQIYEGAGNAPGAVRGNPAVNDAYSSISINFFWRVLGKQRPWWF